MIDNKKVLEIRALARRGVGVVAIARAFGVWHSAIGSIVRGKSWKHLPEQSEGK